MLLYISHKTMKIEEIRNIHYSKRLGKNLIRSIKQKVAMQTIFFFRFTKLHTLATDYDWVESQLPQITHCDKKVAILRLSIEAIKTINHQNQ